jgi:hypothetical protein
MKFRIVEHKVRELRWWTVQRKRWFFWHTEADADCYPGYYPQKFWSLERAERFVDRELNRDETERRANANNYTKIVKTYG